MESVGTVRAIGRAYEKFKDEENEHEKATQSAVCIIGGVLVDHAGGGQYRYDGYHGKDREDAQSQGEEDPQSAKAQQ
jgi:hypothetical protein